MVFLTLIATLEANNKATSEGSILGCWYPAADNYNPMATVDDGSCIFGQTKSRKLERAANGSKQLAKDGKSLNIFLTPVLPGNVCPSWSLEHAGYCYAVMDRHPVPHIQLAARFRWLHDSVQYDLLD